MRYQNITMLTGYVDNLTPKKTEAHTRLFFTLSVPRSRKDGNGNYIREYDRFSCVYWGSRDDSYTGEYSKRIDNFLENVTNGQKVKIYGELRSQTFGLVCGSIVKISKDTKDRGKIERYITECTVNVNAYEVMETKEAAEKRRHDRNTDELQEVSEHEVYSNSYGEIPDFNEFTAVE